MNELNFELSIKHIKQTPTKGDYHAVAPNGLIYVVEQFTLQFRDVWFLFLINKDKKYLLEIGNKRDLFILANSHYYSHPEIVIWGAEFKDKFCQYL
jgi:hypothetical protein